MSKVIDSHKVVTVDMDDTIVMWNLSDYPDLPRIKLDCYGPAELVPNTKNINLVRKLYKLGYTIIAWSQTGFEWAHAVSKAVGLDDVVSLYMTKPRYHVDDLPSTVWMGDRLWRDPVTGNSDIED